MIQCPGFVSIVQTRKDDFVPETTPGSVSKVTWQVTSADTLVSSRESDISPLVFSVMPKLQHERHTEGKLERFSKISFGFARKVAFKTVGGANAAVWIRYPAHDTDETKAARRIQAFFIDIRRRQRHAIIPALASLRASYFQLCLKLSRSRTWESTVDRVVFLSLWPHALACLEAMRMQFQLMKDRASNRLQHASHQDLEELGANTAKIHELLRNTTRLQDILQPGASSLEDPHAELQSHLHAIQALVETLPRSIGSDIEDEWSLVKKGLKQPAKILRGHR
ncbi:hypothetical protein PHLCEN_2v8163 [Hermanssonia centrifuga]|uniref:Uncharacterized protein n=1 Tax=Hermanssonia centrifuga TaxID=98765 RepID=A0A2R6NUH8_9APHY|nr:hypothetical protein PHLCEN_2v8163 [Hermanssonia centrifuga]